MRKYPVKYRSIYDEWQDSTLQPPPKTNKNPTFWATGEDLQRLADNAQSVSCWDFNAALGDTIREKYESLWVKVNELTQILLRKGATGYFWIATSPEVASIFETALTGFKPISASQFTKNQPPFDDQHPMGLKQKEIQDVGTVAEKWRLFKTDALKENVLLIGVNNYEEESCCYARMTIANFII